MSGVEPLAESSEEAQRILRTFLAAFETEVARITGGALTTMRRVEFVDRLACALWVSWDPVGRARDPSALPGVLDTHYDAIARRCVDEAERLWRIRNEPEGIP